jgi:hypothetical protein
MPVVAIASGTVESPLGAAVAGLLVALVFAMGAATGVGVWAAVAFCAAASACAVVSPADLLDDLPGDLPSPVWPLPDFLVEEAALPLPDGLLPEALVLLCSPAAMLSELELELVCVSDGIELVELLGGWVPAGAWAGAGCGAGAWALMDSSGELLSISAAKLSLPTELDGSGDTGFGCTLNRALAAVSNVTLTTASLLRKTPWHQRARSGPAALRKMIIDFKHLEKWSETLIPAFSAARQELP